MFSSLTSAQAQALSAAQLNGLTKANFDALNVSYLSNAQISGLSAASLGYLTLGQTAELTTTEIAAFTASQLSSLPNADLAALTKAQAQALTASQISGMSVAAFDALALGNLLGAQFGGVTAAEMSSISTANFDKYVAPALAFVGAAGLTGVTLTQAQSLSAAQINGLTTAEVAGLSSVVAAYVKDYRGVFAQLALVETQGALTFAGAQSLLQAEAVGGMSAGKFAALQAVASELNAPGGVVASAEVQQLFDDVVLGNAANRSWTGGAATSVALGNLSASSTATQTNELIGKWFLGSDDPSIVGPGMVSGSTYKAATGSLFGASGVLSYTQVNQGDVGDCYFVAALAGLAQQDPSLVKNMITVNGNGTYTVDFWNGANQTSDYVTVDSSLAYMNGYRYASGSTLMFDNGGASGVLWSSVVEKAFVEFETQSGRADSYAAISGGWDNGLAALTGQTIQDYTPAGDTSTQLGALLSTMQNALSSGNVVLMNDSSANSALHLVGSHMYDVLAVNAAAGTVTLDNPWNGNGALNGSGMVFTDALSSLANAGSTFHVAVGAARTH